MQPNEVVEGKYRLAKLLGEGAFGEVWAAVDIQFANRRVAIKFLKAEMLARVPEQFRPQMVARFEREATALAAVNHRNVVTVYERGAIVNGPRYIVMERVEGVTLHDWLEKYSTLDLLPELPKVWALFDQICKGVGALHAVQDPGPIVHRDLKSENVMLLPEGAGQWWLKVLDLGIARMGDQKDTHTGFMLGTDLYMAPEQVLGHPKEIGPWTDVFALGVVLVEMLTAQRPPSGADKWSTVALKYEHETRARLGAQRADVPPVVWDIVTRALRCAGGERYRDATALGDALRLAVPMATAFGPMATGPATFATAGTPAGVTPAYPAAVPMQPSPTRVSNTPPPPAQAFTALGGPMSPGGPPGMAGGTQAAFPGGPTFGGPLTGTPVNAPASPRTSRWVWAAAIMAVSLLVVMGGVALAVGFHLIGSPADAGPPVAPPPQTAATVTPPHEPAPAAGTTPPPVALPVTPVLTTPCEISVVHVPAGTFNMGTAEGDTGSADERPQHVVRLSAFAIDRTEVTVACFRRYWAAGGQRPPAEIAYPGGHTVAWTGGVTEPLPLTTNFCNWSAHPGTLEQQPINCLDWPTAQAYCVWEHGGRLPTEAEWEYAARGSDGRPYPWGPETPGEQLCWSGGGAPAEGTCAVGSFPSGASAFGALDMAGNVWEWTADEYAPYPATPVENPLHIADGTSRVIRGGNWMYGLPAAVRTAYRNKSVDRRRMVTIGFRCVH